MEGLNNSFTVVPAKAGMTDLSGLPYEKTFTFFTIKIKSYDFSRIPG
jgi:hypothetical protein